MEIRVVSELSKIYPVSSIVYEIIKADVDLTSGRKGAGSGKGFSPVMCGQRWGIERLRSIAPVKTVLGWQNDGNGTSQIRNHLGLTKTKDKKAQTPESHAVDGIALASTEFIRFGLVPKIAYDSRDWIGSVTVTHAPFKVITRADYFRRALHFDNADKGGLRKRKGGTITPFGVRCGDKVKATKSGVTVFGWVGGYTKTAKTKNIAVYDHNWKRLGQYSPSKVQLIRRATKLCVAQTLPIIPHPPTLSGMGGDS